MNSSNYLNINSFSFFEYRFYYLFLRHLFRIKTSEEEWVNAFKLKDKNTRKIISKAVLLPFLINLLVTLRNIKKLEFIDLSNTNVEDISPLANLPNIKTIFIFARFNADAKTHKLKTLFCPSQ